MKKITFSLMIISGLTACGGGDDSSTSVTTEAKESISVVAENITTYATITNKTNIDLSDKVHLSTSNADFHIVDIEAKNDATQCQSQIIDEKTLSISSSDVNDCVYQYKVAATSANTHQEKTAYLRVGVGDSGTVSELPIINKNFNIADINADGGFDINLTTELTAQAVNLTGYKLSEQITVLGSGHAEQPTDGVLRYIPAQNQNSVSHINILYSYRKENITQRADGALGSENDIKFGSVVLSISSDTGNNTPQAQGFIYNKVLKANTSEIIDVKNYISDPDGHDLQLVDVQGINVTVDIYGNPADSNFTNTKFSFLSSEPGYHDVLYTISDHNGGYHNAIARILVEPDMSLLRPWDNITIFDSHINNNLTFLAPLNTELADYLEVTYASANTESDENLGPVGQNIPMFTLEQARNYCSNRNGRLPIEREINTLLASEGHIYQSHGWPTQIDYWTADRVSEITAKTRMLNDGTENVANIDEHKYVACVSFTEDVKPFSATTTYVPDANIGIKYQITTTLTDPDGAPAPYQTLDLFVEEKAGFFNDSTAISADKDYGRVTTDLNGQVRFNYYDASYNTALIWIRAGNLPVGTQVIDPTTNTNTNLPFLANNWNRINHDTGSSGNISSSHFNIDNGLPLWRLLYDQGTFVYTTRIVNVYKTQFKGNNFIGRMRVQQRGVNTPRAGRFTFSLQQIGNSASNLNGSSNYPGMRCDTNKQFSFIYDYRDRDFQVHNECNIAVSGASLEGFRQQTAYIWFRFDADGESSTTKTGKLYIYISYNSVRPAEPFATVNMNWGGINVSNGYYLTLASRMSVNGYSAGSSFNDAYFENIDFSAWYHSDID